ncbi:hypothetical protein CTH_2277 [Carboxydocella thermautotrophica]|nr:hypothetical protein CTH_2277 [Carboxydocella thermautotrophica]
MDNLFPCKRYFMDVEHYRRTGEIIPVTEPEEIPPVPLAELIEAENEKLNRGAGAVAQDYRPIMGVFKNIEDLIAAIHKAGNPHRLAQEINKTYTAVIYHLRNNGYDWDREQGKVVPKAEKKGQQLDEVMPAPVPVETPEKQKMEEKVMETEKSCACKEKDPAWAAEIRVPGKPAMKLTFKGLAAITELLEVLARSSEKPEVTIRAS